MKAGPLQVGSRVRGGRARRQRRLTTFVSSALEKELCHKNWHQAQNSLLKKVLLIISLLNMTTLSCQKHNEEKIPTLGKHKASLVGNGVRWILRQCERRQEWNLGRPQLGPLDATQMIRGTLLWVQGYLEGTAMLCRYRVLRVHTVNNYSTKNVWNSWAGFHCFMETEP